MTPSSGFRAFFAILPQAVVVACGGNAHDASSSSTPTGGATTATETNAGGPSAPTGGAGGIGTAPSPAAGTPSSSAGAPDASSAGTGGSAGAPDTGTAGSCPDGNCVIPSCTNAAQDGTETDVDCGGLECPDCLPGSACVLASDCSSHVCDSGVCASANCDDATRNADESDVDCGGSCAPCPVGATCDAAADCDSGVCTRTCQAPSCTDLVMNGAETSVDCGGPECPPCAPGTACEQNSDCSSGLCVDTLCASPSCTDLVLNGNETDVDCGGGCPGCDNGLACSTDPDCADRFCSAGTCVEPTCDDALHNGIESDVDCGGGCPPCPAGQGCAVDADCVGGHCFHGRCPVGVVEVEGALVFEAGIGPLALLDGVQLEPGGADELVVATLGEHSLSVLSGGGPGGFTALTRYSGALVRPRLACDIDGDGLVEILFETQYEEYGNYLHLGWELGRMQEGELTSLAAWTDVMADYDFADLDGDGAVDLLFAGGSYDARARLNVKFGDGNGGFGETQAAFLLTVDNGFPEYAYLDSFDVVDANDDQVPDIVLQNGQPGTSAVPAVFLVRGDGSGGFLLPPEQIPEIPANEHDATRLLASGDLDRDGTGDMVFWKNSRAAMTLRLGSPDGSFRDPSIIPLVSLSPVVLRDMDHAGNLEIVTGKELVTLWSGDTLTAEPLASLQVENFSKYDVHFGDFDGNGLEDVVVAHSGRDLGNGTAIGSNLAVYFQRAPFEFLTHQALEGGDHLVAAWVAVDDVDGNGAEDVVTVHDFSGAALEFVNGPSVSYFEGETVIRRDSMDFGDSSGYIGGHGTTGDFNGDGRVDLAVDAASVTAILTQDESGAFLEGQQLTNALGSVGVDLNGDQRTDLVLSGTRTIQAYTADPDGTLVLSDTVALGENDFIGGLYRGDADGDGLVDVLATGYNSTRSPIAAGFIYDDWNHISRTWVLHNAGTGALSLRAPIERHPLTFTGEQNDLGGAQGAAVGDFDGDGVNDLCVAYVEFHQVGIHYSSGPGGPAEVVDCGVLANPNGVVAYDWNGDGRDDLAVSDFASAALTVLQSVGRAGCPELLGHYRLGRHPWNIELLRRSPDQPPAVVAAGLQRALILPFRLKPF
ncbi:MAG: VCBS repeat-containing protein [Polyangiaceae bacterium]|nr:VCBS repeat-containing protein [Polyangiaceae bacterium]